MLLDVQLDEPADVDPRDAGEPEGGKGLLDRDPLGIEDAGLGTDQDTCAHQEVRSSQDWKGRPVIRS